MLIAGARQLLTLRGGPQRGNSMGELGIIENGAVLVRHNKIVDVGTSETLMRKYADEELFDASNYVVMPGFVDPHTHAMWIGDRSLEFEMRIAGKSYMEIMLAGGGIVSTVNKTREANLEQLIRETRPRLERMFAYGTTTAEVKTGYGLEFDTELRMLEATLKLAQELPMDITPTFLAAHAIPVEFADDAQGYTDLICTQMLPDLAQYWQEKHNDLPKPFVDVFCERGAFSLEQSRQVLSTAREYGFRLKIHADEFENLGGASLAVELGATSADHLVKTSARDIQVLGVSETVAVALPCTPFGLAEMEYTPAEGLLNAGACLAIATDLNPGTAWCESMQFAIALACRYLKLTPAQAIVAATINAAAALNMDDKVGSIEPGKQADLLFLNVPDYRHLGYRFGTNLVSRIMKNGKIYLSGG